MFSLSRQELQNERRLHRNPSVLTLPPPYDVALAMPSAAVSGSHCEDGLLSGTNGRAVVDEERDLLPPSYDEALRLLVRLKRDESESLGGDSRVQEVSVPQLDCRTPLLPDASDGTSRPVVRPELSNS